MLGGKVLIVEGHKESREGLASALNKAGFDTVEASSQKTAIPALIENEIEAIVTELKLPDGDGLSLLNHLKKNGQNRPVIIVTAFGTMSSAIQAMKMGATDFLPKPVAVKDITRVLGLNGGTHGPEGGKNGFVPLTQAPLSQTVIVGTSAPMKQLLSLLERVAPYNGNILLCGESGSGKEVIAREIHRLSPRADKPFVPINCASISYDLLENELFGHERGAFTGANERKIGVFETANQGTLFLDEINEMGLRSQAKLLRALERMEFRRLGGTIKIRTDIRLISASNVSLEDEVKERRIRADLYYRIKVVTLNIPPLRDRKADIPLLIKAFLQEIEKFKGRYIHKVLPEALARLQSYSWPGNVRELKNVVESMALLTEGDVINLHNLPPNIRGARRSQELMLPVGITMEEAEKEIIRHYLEYFHTKKEAAKALDIGLRTLFHKIKAYHLH